MSRKEEGLGAERLRLAKENEALCATKEAVLAFATQRLEALLSYPHGWGNPFAVELQFVLLVETLLTVRGAPKEHVDATHERWERHIVIAKPCPMPLPLAFRCGVAPGHSMDEATPEFIAILRDFYDKELAACPSN